MYNHHPKLAISLPYLKKNVNKILSCLGLKQSSVEITFARDAYVKRQNLKFMNKNGTTDVLSFPQIEINAKQKGNPKVFSTRFLGDILISLDQANRQAKQQKISLSKEVTFLIIHSILHLLGYDHASEKERIEMQRLESKIWRSIYKKRR